MPKPSQTKSNAAKTTRSSKHGNGLDRNHVEAVLAEDPLQADYRKWRMSIKYTAKDVALACVVTGVAVYALTAWAVSLG